MLRFLLNAIWFRCSGLRDGLGWWWLVGARSRFVDAWARAVFVESAIFVWLRVEAIKASEITGRTDLGTGPLGWWAT